MVPNRRSFITGMAAAALAAAGPLSARAPSSRQFARKPARLRAGDTLGLVAPAGFVGDRFGIEAIETAVRAMGLVPKLASNLLTREGYLAGDDRRRAADFQAMFADDSVAAVMSVRGGWGCARILPYLDFEVLARNPKLFVGFSDNTALHMAIAVRCGFPTIHGPNAATAWQQSSWNAFHALAFEGETPTIEASPYPGNLLTRGASRVRTFRSGKATGRLLGGNLTVLSALVGTPYLPDFSGAILFLEDVNESEYRIDRMLTQLALSGLLGKVAGIVFGRCTSCAEQAAGYGNFTIYEVLDRAFAPLGVPAFQGAPFGHVSGQISIPEGVMAEIDADAGTIRVLEPAVR
ncbi:S66 peptidase family protein [Novosphingobium sp. M1R2S20]|uniref:LD-carboxypeptidase n=1 Tax=Novosphingobium rhizovicinum TaxID=3228928 RepID=A0ABV3R9Y9_9SPHN